MSESIEKYTASEQENVADGHTIDVAEQTHHPKNWLNFRVIANALIIGLSLGLYGYDNVFVGPLVSLPLFVLKYQGPGVGGVPAFTANSLVLMVCIPLVGAALGAFGAVPTQNYLGRKGTFLLAYALCCIPGSFLQLFAPNMGAMVFGRAWNYFGISMLTNAAPIWLSELMPAHVRGRSVGSAIAGVGVVQICAAVIVWGTSQIPDDRQFQIPLAVQASVPVVLFFLTLLATESPVWLLSKNRHDEARRNMLSLRNNNAEVTDAELAVQAIALKQKDELAKKVRWWDMLKKKHIERTIMAGFPTSASQASGVALVGTYGTVLLIEAGIPNAYVVTIIVTAVQFAGACFGPWLYDRAGRRSTALFVYVIITILSAALAGLGYTGLLTATQQHAFAALTILLSFSNAITNALGMLMATEIPTATLREPTMTWMTFWGYVTAICTTFIIPEIISAGAGNMGPKAYIIFTCTSLVIVVIIYFYLPETAGRTLADIDELYGTGLPKRKWSSYVCSVTNNEAAMELEAEHHQAVSA